MRTNFGPVGIGGDRDKASFQIRIRQIEKRLKKIVMIYLFVIKPVIFSHSFIHLMSARKITCRMTHL